MGMRLLKLAAIYWVTGMTLGVYMGSTENFTLMPVHAHINLLGWASMAIAGFVFHLVPQLSETRCARGFFWLYNLAVPVLLASLAYMLLGHPQAGPVVGVASVAVALSGALFAWNLLVNAPARAALRPAVAPVLEPGSD